MQEFIFILFYFLNVIIEKTCRYILRQMCLCLCVCVKTFIEVNMLFLFFASMLMKFFFHFLTEMCDCTFEHQFYPK